MLDIKFIRENRERVEKAVQQKKVAVKADVDLILSLDDEIRSITDELDAIRQQRNELDKKIKSAKDDAERKLAIEENTALKPKAKELEEKLAEIKAIFDAEILKLPNVTSDRMPVGAGEEENQVVKTWGEPPQFDFEPKDHVDLGKSLGIIDVEKSGEISGSRFYYLMGEAARMQFGLVQMVFETLANQELIGELAKKVGNPYDNPFIPVVPPVMMKPEVMKKMDRLDPIDERYQLKDDELILVGSAEHTLGPLHMNEIIDEKNLPIRYIGYSTAFRREAGSHGKDVRGILRVHQFDKLEMESYVPEEYGQQEQDLFVAIQEYLVQQLEIPYRVVQICTGDTGKPDYNQYDIECWIPSQNLYRETHTSDYMTDFQSRRLNIKYRTKDGDKKYVYMNDATAFAIGRILIAILENNQQKDGSVRIPKVLQKYIGKESITPKN